MVSSSSADSFISNIDEDLYQLLSTSFSVQTQDERENDTCNSNSKLRDSTVDEHGARAIHNNNYYKNFRNILFDEFPGCMVDNCPHDAKGSLEGHHIVAREPTKQKVRDTLSDRFQERTSQNATTSIENAEREKIRQKASRLAVELWEYINNSPMFAVLCDKHHEMVASSKQTEKQEPELTPEQLNNLSPTDFKKAVQRGQKQKEQAGEISGIDRFSDSDIEIDEKSSELDTIEAQLQAKNIVHGLHSVSWDAVVDGLNEHIGCTRCGADWTEVKFHRDALISQFKTYLQQYVREKDIEVSQPDQPLLRLTSYRSDQVRETLGVIKSPSFLEDFARFALDFETHDDTNHPAVTLLCNECYSFLNGIDFYDMKMDRTDDVEYGVSTPRDGIGGSVLFQEEEKSTEISGNQVSDTFTRLYESWETSDVRRHIKYYTNTDAGRSQEINQLYTQIETHLQTANKLDSTAKQDAIEEFLSVREATKNLHSIFSSLDNRHPLYQPTVIDSLVQWYEYVSRTSIKMGRGKLELDDSIKHKPNEDNLPLEVEENLRESMFTKESENNTETDEPTQSISERYGKSTVYYRLTGDNIPADKNPIKRAGELAVGRDEKFISAKFHGETPSTLDVLYEIADFEQGRRLSNQEAKLVKRVCSKQFMNAYETAKSLVHEGELHKQVLQRVSNLAEAETVSKQPEKVVHIDSEDKTESTVTDEDRVAIDEVQSLWQDTIADSLQSNLTDDSYADIVDTDITTDALIHITNAFENNWINEELARSNLKTVQDYVKEINSMIATINKSDGINPVPSNLQTKWNLFIDTLNKVANTLGRPTIESAV